MRVRRKKTVIGHEKVEHWKVGQRAGEGGGCCFFSNVSWRGDPLATDTRAQVDKAPAQ